MKSNDEELVRRTLSGEVESFGELISRYQSAVQGLAYHMAGNFEDAEDIAQETFITAYLKLRQLRDPESFVPWLRQITFNCCKMQMRKHKDSVSLDEVEKFSLGIAPSPGEELERQETQKAVRSALNQLSEKNRLVAILHYLDGSTYKDIAHFLGVPVSTVEGRMHRAKKQLKRRLVKMVENTLGSEKLSDEFTRRALDEAIKRAKEAQEQWAKDDFVRSCSEALEAAGKLDDSKVQIELLSMLGNAGATWLGETEEAIGNYESALKVAQKHGDKAEEANVLKAMSVAHCRHGEYDRMRQRAQESLELFSEIGDGKNEALAKAALDLADTLPGVWSPGQTGGYAMVAFPIEVGDDGYTFLDPESVRNYSWGCPSRCAALAHLLRPRRVLGASLSVGSAWDDQVSPSPNGLSWKISGEKLMARSEVESEDDTVMTPAGEFQGCLRVKTVITPPDGGIAAEHTERSYCGTRTTWFAPGIGLVKLHHQQQDGFVWTVYLVEHSGPDGDEYFPLSTGQMWRYRWLAGRLTNIFEDICRVTSGAGDTAYISSATWAVEQSKDEALKCLGEMLKLEIGSNDLAGEAAALDKIHSSTGGDEKSHERLAEIYAFLGDKWNLLNSRWILRAMKKELLPQEQIQWLEERIELAHQLGNWMQEATALVSLGQEYLDNDRERALELWEQAVSAFAKHDDANHAAFYTAAVELEREKLRQPPTPQIGYIYGVADISEKDDKLYSKSSSRIHFTGEKFPPGDEDGSQMTDFFYCDPFGGIELLRDDVGSSCTDVSNTGSPWGHESMRTASTLTSKSEAITAPAGEFSGCALVETHVIVSDEVREGGAERDACVGYWAGIKQAWFAPGIGLVRMLRQHKNGYATDIQLMEYEMTDPSEDFFPLALNNRWRYRWVDQKTGTVFEESLRVAARKEGEWTIAFVTRATAK